MKLSTKLGIVTFSVFVGLQTFAFLIRNVDSEKAGFLGPSTPANFIFLSSFPIAAFLYSIMDRVLSTNKGLEKK